jgi:hypothetical protein
MRRKNFIYRRLMLFSAFLFLAFFAFEQAAAQSGRRMPKVKSPAPTETPAPQPTPQTPVKTPVKPAFSLKVFSNISRAGLMQVRFPDRMPRWVVERLRNSVLLDVVQGGEATLKKAQEMAKETADTFIVLVELDENRFADASASRSSQRDIWIDFTVLTPGTGKTKQKGRVYLNSNLTGRNRGVLGRKISCYPTLNNDDYILWEASFETAERIMAGFDLPLPPLECGRMF